VAPFVAGLRIVDVGNVVGGETAVKFLKITIAACTLAACVAGTSQAQTVSAQNGFGVIGSDFSSCKTVATSAPFTSGTLISASDWTDNCVGYYSVVLDTTAKTLTFAGLEVGNYNSAFFDISGIAGVTITSFAAVGANNLFDPAAYGGGLAADLPAPTLSFTANSLHIEWTSIGNVAPADQFAFSGTGGISVFAYNAGSVPEPATWAMMVGGFALAGGALRRRMRPQSTASGPVLG